MKKILADILIVALGIILLPSRVYAKDTQSVIEEIRAFVYTFDGLITEVTYERDLMDINDDYSFSLYNIIDTGYAIVSKKNGNIVDIFYSKLPEGNEIYYIGANFFAKTNENIQIQGRSATNSDILLIKEKTNAILNEESHSFTLESRPIMIRGKIGTIPDIVKGGTQVGIAESRMDLFNSEKWINRSEQCGAYVAIVMLSYMEKYAGGGFFYTRIPVSSSDSYADYILGRTKAKIYDSTTTFGVASCLNQIMYADYPKSGHSSNITATESTYKSKIKASRPVILFLPSLKNTAYGEGHFVLAYRYVDYNGALWFYAYDNREWINRNWIENGIYVA